MLVRCPQQFLRNFDLNALVPLNIECKFATVYGSSKV